MKQPKFFIGIDFGHGETSVSRVPGINGQEVSRIPLRTSGNFMEQKVYSAICRNDNGNWQFVRSEEDFSKPDLREGFKGIIKDLEGKQRESLCEFAKLVFDSILQHDPDLKYNPKTGEANFVICIANPTDWRRQDPHIPTDYLNFYRTFANILPAKMCINESDAAFYTKFSMYKPEDTVLVVDIGSSTVDFTTYHNSECKKECCWGRNTGAHHVEDLLIDSGYPKQGEYSKVKEKNKTNMNLAEKIRTSEEYKLGSAKPVLSLAVRLKKESYFTNELTTFDYELKFPILIPNWGKKDNDIKDNDILEKLFKSYFESNQVDDSLIPNRDNKRETAFELYLDSDQVTEVLESYYDQLRKTFKEAAEEKLGKYGIVPSHVLLSGGASRMPIVYELAKKYFPKSKIYKDPYPEWIVSDGAARYAKVHFEALQARDELQEEFKNWAHENLDDRLCSVAVSTFNTLLKEILTDGLQSQYIGGTDGSLNELENITRNLLESVTKTYSFKSKADNAFKAVIDDFIKEKLEQIIESKYGKKISITENFIDPGDTFSNVAVRTEFLHDTIAEIANLHCNNLLEGKSSLDWTKSRAPEKKAQLVSELLNNIEYSIFNHNIDLNEFVEQAVDKIDRILHENGFFQISE